MLPATFKSNLAALPGALLLLLVAACTHSNDVRQGAAPTVRPADLLSVPDSELPRPLVFIVYGDMRFTDMGETQASAPGARHALVAGIAAERPQALFLTGDVPWHGGTADDYRVYGEETAAWQDEQLRVYPVLGNHEFQRCEESACLENWWATFPQLRGRRWYSVALGSRLRVFALDSDASLLAGSEQATWLEQQFQRLDPGVAFVLILLHHPPFTDVPQESRANEQALATYLASVARQSSSIRIIVCAAHVHNYERFEHDGLLYLVSGGGGAKPSAIARSAADRYQDLRFPNFHYLRFELDGERLTGEMHRLTDFNAAAPGAWAINDRFELSATLSRR